MPLLRSARGEPRIGTSVNHKNASRLCVCIALLIEQSNRNGSLVTYYFCAFYTKDSLRGFLAEREIIANAFLLARILPEHAAKVRRNNDSAKTFKKKCFADACLCTIFFLQGTGYRGHPAPCRLNRKQGTPKRQTMHA